MRFEKNVQVPTFVNGLTFEVFLAMELEIRSHLQGCKPVNFITDIAPTVKNSDYVLLLVNAKFYLG